MIHLIAGWLGLKFVIQGFCESSEEKMNWKFTSGTGPLKTADSDYVNALLLSCCLHLRQTFSINAGVSYANDHSRYLDNILHYFILIHCVEQPLWWRSTPCVFLLSHPDSPSLLAFFSSLSVSLFHPLTDMQQPFAGHYVIMPAVDVTLGSF